MSIITDLTRMWLTRSGKPFTFTNEYNETLPYADCQGLGQIGRASCRERV